jgi:hypothetical protein
MFGVGDGDRTRDIRCHRPTLYQLSYAHQWINRGQFTLKPASIEMGGGLSGAEITREASDAMGFCDLPFERVAKTLKYAWG